MEQTREIALPIETFRKKGRNTAEIPAIGAFFKKDVQQVVSELKNDFKI